MHFYEIHGLPYEIARNGVVRRLGSDRPLVPSVNQTGRYFYQLADNYGNYSSYTVASLLGRTFLTSQLRYVESLSRNQKPTILFKDGDYSNYLLDNIRWVSRSYAINYHKWISNRLEEGDKARAFKRTTYWTGGDSTQDIFQEFFEACIHYGVLPSDMFEMQDMFIENNGKPIKVSWYEDLYVTFY